MKKDLLILRGRAFFLITVLLITSMVQARPESWTSEGIVATSFAAGSGDGSSTEQAIIISTPNELAFLAKEINENQKGNTYAGKYFKLVPAGGKDYIDLAEYEWEPIGDFSNVDYSTVFQGNFDGNGCTIRNINVPERYVYAGLFGYISGDNYDIKIENLTFEGGEVWGAASESSYTGALVGSMHYGNISFSNCYNNGVEIYGGSGVSNTGGLVGWTNGVILTIHSCVVRAMVQGGGTDVSCTGGLFGYFGGTLTLSDSYVDGEIRGAEIVEGHNRTGGLVGEIEARATFNASNCYVTGLITGGNGNGIPATGGLVGYSDANSIFTSTNNLVFLQELTAPAGTATNRILGNKENNETARITNTYALVETGGSWTGNDNGTDWNRNIKGEPIQGWDDAIWSKDPDGETLPILEDITGEQPAQSVIYNLSDYNWLKSYVEKNKAFFQITEGGQARTYADFNTWFAAEFSNDQYPIWNLEKPKRITYIQWEGNGQETDPALGGSFDISGLVKLQQLYISKNRIDELILGDQLSELHTLACGNNKLNTLDLSSLPKLEMLTCCANELTDLTLSALPLLKSLDCENNQLTSLDLSQADKLENLNYGGNNIPTLTIKNPSLLKHLNCHTNDIESLDLTEYINLIALYCNDNKLTTLNIKGLTELTTLLCYNNQIEELSLDGMNLQVLTCYQNKLKKLDLSAHTNLVSFNCSLNELTEIKLPPQKLDAFECHTNHLPFSILPLPDVANTYQWPLPQTITLSQPVPAGQKMDLSAFVIDGEVTTVMYGDGENFSLSETEKGFLIPLDWSGKVITFKMTNTAFPNTGDYYLTYKFTVGEPVVPGNYHTIVLETGGDIQVNYTPGSLTVAEGEHLHLEFSTDDATLTAADVLFRIDGKETAFKDSGKGMFSYILGDIRANHTILIAQKEYPVTLPEVDGATTDPVAGTYMTAYGEPFRFTVIVENDEDAGTVKVYANGEPLEIENRRSAQANGELRRDNSYPLILNYQLPEIIGPVKITIEGIRSDPTSNATLQTSQCSFYISNGTLWAETLSATQLSVYSLTGQLITGCTVTGRKAIRLAPGLYIIKAGDQVTKVVAR